MPTIQTLPRSLPQPASRNLSPVELLERMWLPAWCLFTMAYFMVGLAFARRVFWYDELFTLYLSRMSKAQLWQALLSGVDQNSPVFYWISGAASRLLSSSEAGLRVPALVGGWLTLSSVFLYVKRACGILWAWAACLLLISSGASYYFVEARPYGLLMGCASVAFLAWQRRALPLMAAALTLAALCHPYAIVLFVPFTAGEIARCRFDWRAWLAFVPAVMAYAVYLPIRNGVHGTLQYTWARPELSKIPEAYIWYAGSMLPLLLGILLATACWCLLTSGGSLPQARDEVPWHEAVALVGLILLPLPGLALGRITGIFTPRYTVECSVGLAIVFVLLLFRAAQGRPAFAWLLFVMTLGWLSWNFWSPSTKTDSRNLPGPVHESEQISAAYHLLPMAERSDLPLVASSGLVFLELDHYVSSAMAARLHLLLDRSEAIEHTDVDLFDAGLPLLRRWFPLRAALDPYHEFTARNRRFLVIGYWDSAAANDWLIHRLLHDGAHVEALGKSDRAWRSFQWSTGISDMRYLYLFDVTMKP